MLLAEVQIPGSSTTSSAMVNGAEAIQITTARKVSIDVRFVFIDALQTKVDRLGNCLTEHPKAASQEQMFCFSQ